MRRPTPAAFSLPLVVVLAAPSGCRSAGPDNGGQSGDGTGAGTISAADSKLTDGGVDTTATVVDSDSTAEGSDDAPSDATGPNGSDDGEAESTGSTAGTPLMPIDVSAPEWVGVVDGHMALTVPDAVPVTEETFVLSVGGTRAESTIEFGAGDPEPITLPHNGAASALGFYDTRTGQVQSARLIGEAVEGFDGRFSVRTQTTSTADNGDLLVAGFFTGDAVFFPGTAEETTRTTLSALIGDTLHRAEDPFFVRVSPAGEIVWALWGRTTPPLTGTWYNTPGAVVPLADGTTFISGNVRQSFVLGDGAAGQTSLVGNRSYFARVGADGSLGTVFSHSDSAPVQPMALSESGRIYGLVSDGATLFLGTEYEVQVLAEPGLDTRTVARIDPDGGIDWSVNFALDGNNRVLGVAAAADDGLLVHGRGTGELTVRDADDEVQTAVLEAFSGWVASLDAAGSLQWLITDPALFFTATGTLPAADGSVWVAAEVRAPFELPISGEVQSLPDLELGELETASTLLRFADGTITHARVFGRSLDVESLGWADATHQTVLVAGDFSECASTEPAVVDQSGTTLTSITVGCSAEETGQAFVARVAI